MRAARVVRRRRLLRAAAVSGMASQAGKRIDLQAGSPAPPPANPGADTQATILALDHLGALHERGVLSDQEFAEQKRRVLEG